MEMLKIFGQVAGLGGLALGVLLIIFRSIIQKTIYPTLTKEQSYNLLRLIIFLTWSIALLGISVWAASKYVNHKESDTIKSDKSTPQPPPSSATPTATVMPVNSPPPSKTGQSMSLPNKPKSDQTDNKSPNVEKPQPPRPKYVVTLLVPSTMKGATVTVDGEPAQIIKTQPTFITILVDHKESAHRILLTKGNDSCSTERKISGEMQITPCQ